MNFKALIHSLVAAVIGAVGTGITTSLASPATFNFTHAGLINLASACGVSALIAVAAVLKQSPLSPDSVASAKGVLQAALVAFMIGSVMLTTTGCTQAQKVSVAQEIVNWTPALVSAIDTAGGLVDTLDPGAALIVDPLVTGVNVLAPQFATAAKNYLANPTQTNIQTVQALIVQIQNSVNTSLSLLQALKVSNPASQQKAIVAVNGIGTIVNTLLGLIQGISSHAQVAAMSADVTVHLAAVQGILDRKGMEVASARVSADLHLPLAISADGFLSYERQAGF